MAEDPKMHVGRWLQQGFRLYFANGQDFLLIFVSMLIATLISLVTLGLLAGPMMAGVLFILLRLVDGTEPRPEISDVFRGFDVFADAFLFSLIWWVIVPMAITAIFAFVPLLGPLLAAAAIWAVTTLLMFGLFFIVEQKQNFYDATRKSFFTIKQHFWPLFGLNVVASLIAGVGGFACFVGFLVTAPIYWCVIVFVYRHFFPAEA
mgnify:CR=1 FL=1